MSDTHSDKTMRAVRIHAFGGVDAMSFEEMARPVPGPGQLLVRVAAAGVGPWDAWIRAGTSVLPQPLPLTLGSDLSGVVEAIGPDVRGFHAGDAVFGVTNPRFIGAYAEYAVAEAGMVAAKPARLSHTEAASVPVVASTAQQMLFTHAKVRAGQTILVLGGAGSVGAYAVQLARRAGAHVIATARATQAEDVRRLGAEVVAPDAAPLRPVDAVIDTVGGDALVGAFAWLRPGGVLVSVVAEPDRTQADRAGVSATFMLVSVTSAGLAELAELFDSGKLRPHVGEVLPLAAARTAHEMLAGAPHRAGKIVLVPGA